MNKIGINAFSLQITKSPYYMGGTRMMSPSITYGAYLISKSSPSTNGRSNFVRS